jgi:hypothetical protein
VKRSQKRRQQAPKPLSRANAREGLAARNWGNDVKGGCPGFIARMHYVPSLIAPDASRLSFRSSSAPLPEIRAR